MQAWEHISVRFGSDPPKPWVSASDEQMNVVRDLQRVGFECVGVTTLREGSLFMMFKRPVEVGASPPPTTTSKAIQIGFAPPPKA